MLPRFTPILPRKSTGDSYVSNSVRATVTKIKRQVEKHPFNNESWGGDQEIFVENQRKVLRSKGTAGYWEEIC